MKSETITRRADLVIRRHILEPGEALPWHTDLCHRFTVVVTGDRLSIEYRESGEVETFPVHPGLADWDAPLPKVHRGINAGTVPYKEVIIFFLDEPGIDHSRKHPEDRLPPVTCCERFHARDRWVVQCF